MSNGSKVRRRRPFAAGWAVPSPQELRVRAVRALGGRLGGLRLEWRSRSANGWDVHVLTVAHLEVMEASRRWHRSCGRAACEHGTLQEPGFECLPCLFGEDAQTTAKAYAVRDVIRFGGWGQPEPLSAARARVCSVRWEPVPVSRDGLALAS
jgi:hypothetical protein